MTALQRRNIHLYVRYRGRRMTIASLLWANRLIYLLLSVLFGAVAALLSFTAGPAAASYVGVAFAAVIIRDIGYYRRSVMLWPMLDRVLDWERVELLAASPAADGAARQ